MRCLIIGYGNVGTNLAREIGALGPHIYDTGKGIDERRGTYDLAFVCVDTPMTDYEACHVWGVHEAIMDSSAEVFVVKSTVLPRQTEELARETGKRLVFSPEYYGTTQHANAKAFDFTVLGGDREDCVKVVQALQEVYDASHRFVLTDPKTAELAKYMENAWLATKVSFCNQFARIAEAEGVCYEELREIFVMDPRVNPSHTFVYRDHPYWDTHCLSKDVPAIAMDEGAQLLLDVIRFNETCKVQAGEERP